MQGTDPKLIDALNRASSLELFHLSTVIERLMTDPRRIIAVRKNMHMGQTVRFMSPRDGQMHEGRVMALKDTQVTLHQIGARFEWKLPYAAIEPPQPDGRMVPEEEPELPAPRGPGRADFRCGEKVSFADRHLQNHVGVITRINQRTASVDTGDGSNWRVPFPALRHVLDV